MTYNKQEIKALCCSYLVERDDERKKNLKSLITDIVGMGWVEKDENEYVYKRFNKILVALVTLKAIIKGNMMEEWGDPIIVLEDDLEMCIRLMAK